MSRALTLAALAVGAIMGASYMGGLRCNMSPSMPMGLWVVEPLKGVVHGSFVTLCLDPAPAVFGRTRGYLTGGECPGDVEMLIKTVIAVPGDVVTVMPDGIAVNGHAVANTEALAVDDIDRPMQAFPEGIYPVAPGEVWVIGVSDRRSYDSRYFGPVRLSGLRGQARPLFTN